MHLLTMFQLTQISSNANAAVDAVRDGIEGATQAVKDKIDEARGKA
jgi:hypothetical protein